MAAAVLPDLVRRQQATTATFDRFAGKPFGWRTRGTCLHLLHFHLRKMGKSPPKVPELRSALAAQRLLTSRGWNTCADLMDSLALERIAPAAMLLGDVAFRASEDGPGGLLICGGPGKLFGWFENEEAGGRMVVMDMSLDQVGAAWRV